MTPFDSARARPLFIAALCMSAAGLTFWLLWARGERDGPLPATDSVESVEVFAFDKRYAVDGERAKRIRRLFDPAERIDSQTKWISWGDASFKRRGGGLTKVSLFMSKEANLEIFEVADQFYRCTQPNQLNEIAILAGMKVNDRLLPIEWKAQP